VGEKSAKLNTIDVNINKMVQFVELSNNNWKRPRRKFKEINRTSSRCIMHTACYTRTCSSLNLGIVLHEFDKFIDDDWPSTIVFPIA